MKTTTTLAALAIALLPGFAFAQCADKKMEQTAASCMPGTTWDAAKATCIENPSS